MPVVGRTVVITGCSHGGLGDSLAQALHRRGHRVIATARNASKIAHLEAMGMETVVLDVLSAKSIAAAVREVREITDGSIDMLINNSGAGYTMPLVDVPIAAGQELFDLNVWAVLAVTQAFVPLLLASHGHGGALLVNNTSVASVTPVPMQGIYNMSKAAAAMLTDQLRIELAPFGVTVVELKTGAVQSKFFANQNTATAPVLPSDSIYLPARDVLEKVMAGGELTSRQVDADAWAEQVVADLLLPRGPPARVWRGGDAWKVWFLRRFLPHTFLDGPLSKLGKMDVLALRLKEEKAAIKAGKKQS